MCAMSICQSEQDMRRRVCQSHCYTNSKPSLATNDMSKVVAYVKQVTIYGYVSIETANNMMQKNVNRCH